MYRILLATAGVSALIACSDIASEDLRTSGIYADISVTASDDGTSKVGAVLRAGGALSTTFVELTGDDTLTATYQEQTKTLTGVELGAIHSFTTTFDTADAADDFIISFERTLDDGAPNTVIALPDPFEFSALTVTEFSRADDALTVQWTPSDTDDAMKISIDGTCFVVQNIDISGDPGTYTLQAGVLENTGEAATSCEATLTLTRRRAGTLDAGFGKGGSATGIQKRQITIPSNP